MHARIRTKIHRTLLGAAILLLLAGTVAAAEPGHDRAENGLVLARQSLDSAGEPGRLRLEIDPAGKRRLLDVGRGSVRGFPLPGHGSVDLELRSFSLLAPGARFVVVDEEGPREVPGPLFRAFRGHVEGDPDSLVTLTFFGDRIAGFVRTWDGEYVVAPELFDADASGAPSIWVSQREDPPEGESWFDCDGALLGPVSGLSGGGGGTGVQTRNDRIVAFSASGIDNESVSTPLIDSGTLLSATVAIDATVEFYEHFGSLTTTQNYILNLLAQVSTIYESEVLVQIDVGYLRIFTAEPDPYTDGSTSTSVLLADLRSEWTTNKADVTRTVTHLLSVRPSGGSGLAYVDVLCNSNYGYGVSTIEADGDPWEKDMVAHEIGHNFSSPHTHCFVPEIDQCYNGQEGCYSGPEVPIVGTIMSYCSQKDSVFHARVKDEHIRPAAESAYSVCIATAGLPGAIGQGDGGSLRLDRPDACPTTDLLNDDGGSESSLGYGGTTLLAWIKRFTPSCYPYRLTDAEVLITNGSSVTPGRPIRLLVYSDPMGSGDPAMASLVHTEDVTVQTVSSATFNRYALSDPVVIVSGDYYVGFYDLEADDPSTYIASMDNSRDGDSWLAANSTSPESFGPYEGWTWMIRAEGGAVQPGTVRLEWDNPCNAAQMPDQDYAVYTGALGSYLDPSVLTCTTDRARSYLVSDTDDLFYLIVPSTAAAEGSYGLDGHGVERPPAATACKPQDIGACP